jgi:hypothetical protein
VHHDADNVIHHLFLKFNKFRSMISGIIFELQPHPALSGQCAQNRCAALAFQV